jgi:hypothetical protein
MKSVNYISIVIVSIPAVLSVGCGRIVNTHMNYAPANSMVTTPYSFSNKTATNFSCPTLPNVLPSSQQTADNRDYFTVCSSKTSGNYSDLLITGNSSNTVSLCTIPVQMLDSTNYKIKLDSQGSPIYSCGAPSADGVLVSNPAANTPSFNAVIIVESPELNNFLTCQSNLTTCPNYSIGQFR